MPSEADSQAFIVAFGKRIRALRHERKLKQIDLSAKAQIDERQIQRIEAGHTNTSLKTIHRLAEALEVEAGSLFEFNSSNSD